MKRHKSFLKSTALNNIEAQRVWRSHDRARKGYERKWRIEWNKYYLAQGQIILRDKDQPNPAANAFPLKQVRELYAAMYIDIGRAFSRIGFLEPKGINPFTHTKAEQVSIEDLLAWEREMRLYALTYGGESIVSISDTGKKLAQNIIRRATEQAIQEGTSVFDLGNYLEEYIRDEWKLGSRFNAERIARTELATASNQGAYIGAKSTGLNLNKIWLTSLDGREREGHYNAHLQTVGVNVPFIVEGEALNVPGDKTASAANVINCRCAVAYRDKRSFVN